MKINGFKVNIRYADGVAIMHPIGTLDEVTYPLLRDSLLKQAAEQPEALLVEVEDLTMPSASTLTVFSSVSVRVIDWPGIRVILIAPGEDQRTMLRNSAIGRFVPVYETVAAAMNSLSAPPPRSRAVLELLPLPMSTRRARYFVQMNCERWHVGELVPDALLIATALVENTLVHTSSLAMLRMELRAGVLSIAVSDDDPRPAVLREYAEGGVPPSGLLLVSGVAKAWGCAPTLTGGKTVWAVMHVPSRDRTERPWRRHAE